MLYAESLLSRAGLAFGARWLHVAAGAVWLGVLVYVNAVQVARVAALDPVARAQAVGTDVRATLGWYRGAALLTLLTGLAITVATPDYFGEGFGQSSQGTAISAGMALGMVMLVNVWVVAWRNQKVVLAAAAAGTLDSAAATEASRRALMASRQNLVFAPAVVWLMTYAPHGPGQVAEVAPAGLAGYWVVFALLTAVLELNALGLTPWGTAEGRGLNVLYDGPARRPLRNVAVAAVGYWLVVAGLGEVCF